MVKILAAADLHDSYDLAKHLSEKARRHNVDLVVLAGDIHGPLEGKGNILNPFLKHKQKVLFVPGNWDSDKEHQDLRKKAKSIHNYYVTYENVAIAGIGSPNMKFSLDENDFSEIKKQFEKMKPSKRILISHLHAEGTNAEFSGIRGDELLRKAIDEVSPDVLISAHIHEAEGIEDKIGKTKIFQVGRKGKILEI
jgi:Icc-related predicted phosphoesterase